MKKSAVTKSKSKNEWFFVDRLYRYLPLFLLGLSFANVYFVIRYVNRERVDFAEVRNTALLNVSNAYAYVERNLTNEIIQVRQSLSNEVIRFRFRQELRSRPVFGVGVTNSASSVNEPFRLPASVALNGRYFRMYGKSYVHLGNSLYYGVGDDFGYGEITDVFPLGVVCAGRFYQFSNPVSTSSSLTLNREIANGIP